MNTIPLVSIVIPIYKVPEKYLRQCIESCINQTLKDIEIILVDDGSPDDCGKICDEYAAKDERVRVIHKKNGGLAAARNTGQEQVQGETMMFLDGDDYIEMNCCERAYCTLKEHNVELLLFDQIMEYRNSSIVMHSFKGNSQGLELKSYTTTADELKFDGEECKELQLRVLNFNGRIAMVFQKLMLTDMIKRYRIRHVDALSQGMEGFVFNIQLFNHVKSVYYIPDPLLHYMYNPQSITHKPSEKNYHLCVRCMEWISNYIKQSEQYTELKALLYYRSLFLIVNSAISCYFSPMFKESYSGRVNKFKHFLTYPLVIESLKCGEISELDWQRRIVIFAIKKKLWLVLYILGLMRKKQLEMR